MPLKGWRRGRSSLVDAETIGAPLDPTAGQFRNTAAQAGQLRGDLTRSREEAEAALADAATLARVKAALGLPDATEGADVVAAVRRLKSSTR